MRERTPNVYDTKHDINQILKSINKIKHKKKNFENFEIKSDKNS